MACGNSDTVVDRNCRNAGVLTDLALQARKASARVYDDVTGHNILALSWDYMRSAGPIFHEALLPTDSLYGNLHFATGAS